MVHPVMLMVPPATMDVDAIVMSPPPPVAVRLPSSTAAPVESYTRNQPAVPDASADVSPVTEFAVMVPVDGAPNDGSERVRVPKRVPVAAVFAVAGWEPVRISTYPAAGPPSMVAVIAAARALRRVVDSRIATAVLLGQSSSSQHARAARREL